MNFLSHFGLKAALVACGTVSSVAIDTLREHFDIPITGVVEAAAKKACSLSKNKKIDETEKENNLQKGDIQYRRDEFQILAKSLYNNISNTPEDNKVFYTIIAGDYNLCLSNDPKLMHNEIKLEKLRFRRNPNELLCNQKKLERLRT